VKVAIIQFPGSNCDWDAEHSVKDVIGLSAGRVWHKDKLPDEVEAVIVPGGFSFGDYLRCGAIARFSPIMTDLKRLPSR
jgi:Phosphoribosylformylglycinamidine (FGAM) synthase, glutamine amidotransferase domain